MNFSSSRPKPSPKPEDRLKAQLRAEALASTPAFSDDLHQRTLAVLRANGLKGLDTETLRANRYRLRTTLKIAAPLAAAAAVVIALWINLKPAADTPTQQITNNDPYLLPDPTPSDLVNTVAENLDLPTADTLEQAKYGYLDKDAQRLASFVVDQLPTFGLTTDAPQTPPSPQ